MKAPLAIIATLLTLASLWRDKAPERSTPSRQSAQEIVAVALRDARNNQNPSHWAENNPWGSVSVDATPNSAPLAASLVHATSPMADMSSKDVERAEYWKATKGYEFDPNSMTAYFMDHEAARRQRGGDTTTEDIGGSTSATTVTGGTSSFAASGVGGGRYYDPTYRPSVGSHYVSGHVRSDGTYVPGHYKTNSDASFWNNWSSSGNVNPNTGKTGTRTPPSSYSSGSTFAQGHFRSNGSYVPGHYRSK